MVFGAANCFALDHDLVINAVSVDNVGKIKSMIESGELDKNQLLDAEPYGKEGLPLIALAGREGAVKVTKYLIGIKTDLNAKTSVKETALMLAAYFKWDDSSDGYSKNDEVARLLIAAGADLENEPGMYTPLSYAAYIHRFAIGKELIAAGANPNGAAVDGKTKANTPLMMTVLSDDKSFMKLILSAGADVHIVKSGGQTAITLAKKYKRDDLMPWLLCAYELKSGEKFAEKCL